MHTFHIKHLFFGVVLPFLLVGSATAGDSSDLKTEKDRVSYGIGVQTGRNLRKDNVEVDVSMLIRGIEDGIAGNKLLMSERELRQLLGGLQSELRRRIAANRRVLGEENKKAGDEFLAANAAKAGVVTLPSGVQYKVIKAGDGRKPALSDLVMVNYRGTRIDGYEFDASPDGQPAKMNVGQLIAGWKEALQLMPEGSRWEIAIPPHLAYGDRGVGQDIGPHQTLLFDVELVAVK